MNSDFKELLKIFGEQKVEYLIIGGYAVAKHAEPRYTKDLDIWINNSSENAERVYQSLKEFGAPLTDITIEDFTIPTMVFQIGIEPSRIDILMGLKELDFDECWKRRATATIGKLEIYFISLDDLIFNKQLAGRPQDLRDAENLKLKKQEQSKIEKPLPKSD
ncbi:nucleotidyl transferase AbiEii/AbiGii toxin family protein [soil metagenome]